MSERELLDLLAGRRVRAAFLVRYLKDDARPAVTVEAIEFLLDTDLSILISCATDWTLKITEGRWPVLPEWCWPAESWGFEALDQVGRPGVDSIVSKSEIHNSVGELCGLRLEFCSAWVNVRSGDTLIFDVSCKEN